METFFCNTITNIFLLVAIVTKGLTIWGSKCHKKIHQWYVKYEEAEVDRLVAILI